MSISQELWRDMADARERENNDDHLNQSERDSIVSRLRIEDNIEDGVSDEQIYINYIIE